MDLNIFENMPQNELKKYIEFLLHNYRVVDAFWFLNVAERFDQPTAEQINEQVWAKVGGLAAKDLIAAFDIKETGLKGLSKALKLFPWAILFSYEFEEADNQLIISVQHCATQEARKKHGLKEFVCKEMHRREFQGFARQVDERIKLDCLFAPPDPRPANMYCKWRFYI
jgi:hypothetical protein